MRPVERLTYNVTQTVFISQASVADSANHANDKSDFSDLCMKYWAFLSLVPLKVRRLGLSYPRTRTSIVILTPESEWGQ